MLSRAQIHSRGIEILKSKGHTGLETTSPMQVRCTGCNHKFFTDRVYEQGTALSCKDEQELNKMRARNAK
jgi:hypothetical protein